MSNICSFKVAGGHCNYDLGNSTLEVNIMGCKWSKELWQIEYKAIHQSMPAAILEVQVLNVRNDDNERIEYISTAFQDPAIIRAIDLRDIDGFTEDIEDGEREQFQGDSGTPRDALEEEEENTEDALDEEKTVRFQYDGILDMSLEFFTVSNKKETLLSASTECYRSFLDDNTDSFYVINSNQIFIVRAYLGFLIIPEENKRCYDVEDNQYKVVITSNIGLDKNPGSEEYNEKLSEENKVLLSLCSDIAFKNETTGEMSASGPCVVDVVMKEFQNAAGDVRRKAQAEYSLLTGRPNPL